MKKAYIGKFFKKINEAYKFAEEKGKQTKKRRIIYGIKKGFLVI